MKKHILGMKLINVQISAIRDKFCTIHLEPFILIEITFLYPNVVCDGKLATFLRSKNTYRRRECPALFPISEQIHLHEAILL